jgi:hypothetical protein
VAPSTSWIAFAYLVTALMFARVDLYADRRGGRGSRGSSALFQATVIALVFALASGEHFSSYYLFYGSLFFGDRLHRRAALAAHARHRLAAAKAGYRRRALLVGSASTSSRSPTRSATRRTPIEVVGYISLTPLPAQRPALARPLEDLPACSRRADRRGDHRRPRLPRRSRPSSSSTSAISAA